MKIPFNKTFSDKGENLLRRCSYAKQFDKKLNKFSYFKRLGENHFPKYHIYITSEDPLEIDLHLDHKAHTYKGQRAHGGDYDSSQVRAEALRIWKVINMGTSVLNNQTAGSYDQLKKDVKDEKPAGIWKNVFGRGLKGEDRG